MSIKTDWFRKQTWTEEDKQEFFLKLKRVRDKGMQAQYIKLKAGALAYTKDFRLMQNAEDLLHYLFTKYPEDKGEKSQALHMLGDIYKFRGDNQQALDYYKQAIDFEEIFPHSITNAYSDYAILAVKTGRTDLYDTVEEILSKGRYESYNIFPIANYRKYSILSIISKHKNDTEKAKYYADLANENAEMQQSGFNNHKTLGLVQKRDITLDKIVQDSLKTNSDCSKVSVEERQNLIAANGEYPENKKNITIDINRIYKELENAGVNTAKYSSLLAISEPYPKAIPVFVEFLKNEEFDSIRTKEMLVRTLTVKEAKGIVNETLISEYHKYPEEGLFQSYRWAIGNAFKVIITSKDEDNIIDIVSDKSNGNSRQMFVYALKAIKSIRVENTLINLLDDSDVTGHAIYALGALKSQKAKAKIELFLNNKSAYLRLSAKKALKKIG